MAALPLCLRRLVAFSFLAAPAFAQFDPHGAITKWPSDAPKPLEYFDVRFAPDGHPAGDLHERNAALKREPAALARAAEEKQLRADVPLLRIEDDPIFGTPRWLASTARFLTPAIEDGAFDAVVVTREFVAAHPGLFEITPEELDVARRSRDYVTRHNGARHLIFQQQIAGADLYGAELRANVSRRGELVNVSSTMLPRPAGDFAPAPIVLSASDAIRAAAAHIGAVVTADPQPLSAPLGASRVQAWDGNGDFRRNLQLTTEFLYFPITRDEIRPAWKVVLPELGVGSTYEVFVDAADGQVLLRTNRLKFAAGGTQNLSVNVYTMDSPAPGSPGNATTNGFQFPFVSRQLLTITPASVPESPNSWIDDNDTDTQGNNVDAHTDLDNDDNPDLPRPTSATRTFDFPQDNLLDPTAWREAAVTNLFYFCNVYHDRLWRLGFDEAAGNFQRLNFTGQGLADDRIIADAQDGGGTNNANFGVGPDGINGWMQMYVWDGPTPTRDGDLDSNIVYHEYSHGLSFRLHNMALGGDQADGMGEAWGDFFGICLNAEPTDDPNGVYNTGAYSTYLLGNGYVDNYYFGIRRFPCSTDLTKNPQTYADGDPAQQSYPPGVPRNTIFGNQADQAHNLGEIWCNILNELRAGLWATHGFPANELVMQLVVDGMKLDAANPNFLVARDAILQADLLNNGGANQAALWKAFAKRGCGYSASSPATSMSGVVEGFDLPLIFAYPHGTPTRLDPGLARTFQVDVTGVGVFQPVANSGVLHLSVNGGAFTPLPMTQTSPNHYDATLPAGSCFDEYAFYVSVDTNQGTVLNPGNAPVGTYKAPVRTGTLLLAGDSFETDQGWTNFVTGATSGAWERGTPVDDSQWAYDPSTDGDGSGQCYLTQNQTGNTDVDGGSVTLESPNFDMAGGADVTYRYYLNLTLETGSDQLLVEIDSNGGAGPWTSVASHISSGGTNWRTHTITRATLAGLGVTFTSTMRLRFSANDGGTQSIVEAGVDGSRIERQLCMPLLGTSLCSGDGSAAACPCGNSGAPGQGCENSAGTHGARMVAAGTSSPDTAFLTTTGMLPSSVCIVVQGSTSSAPLPYGDGLRCITGTLKRLYTRTAGGGELTVPQLSDPNVSARSTALGDVIPAGATRYYMTYYQDADAAFCATGGTFNASNAVSIVW